MTNENTGYLPQIAFNLVDENRATLEYFINKHIEAEVGSDKIDLKVVVYGPALPLFDKKTADPELQKKFQMILYKGTQPEFCQVSMKVFKKGLDALLDGFKPTAHTVAVKRIADLQEQG